jgi:hypothetical protein
LPSGGGFDGKEAYRFFVGIALLTTVGLSLFSAEFDPAGLKSNTKIEATTVSASNISAEQDITCERHLLDNQVPA